MEATLIQQMHPTTLHMAGTAYDYFNYTVKDDEGSITLIYHANAGSDALDVGQIRFTVAAHTNVVPTSADNTVYVNENNTTLTPSEELLAIFIFR